jgi:hypothetical protein
MLAKANVFEIVSKGKNDLVINMIFGFQTQKFYSFNMLLTEL